MPNERRLRFDSVGGLIDDNPLTAGATTLNSAGLANLGVVGTIDHAALVLDPDALEGNPEIVYVTAHTASATSATILRGQEGTSALQHSLDIPWVHAPTVVDFNRKEVLSAALNADVGYSPANTYVNILSLALTPGTWRVVANLVAQGPVGWVVAKIWDGTTAWASAATYNSTANGGETLTLSPVDIAVTANTTIHLSAATDSAGQTAKAAPQILATGLTGTATRMSAERVV